MTRTPMSGLYGWFSSSGTSDAAKRLERMADGPATGARLLGAAGEAGLGVGTGTPPAVLVDADGAVLCAVGHPRLMTAQGASTDPAAITRHLRTQGAAGLAQIGGDFSLALWDPQAKRGLIATDRIGVRPLFWARVGDALVFASTLDAVARCPGVDTTLSPQSVYDYLYFHVCPGPATIFRGVQRLDAGCAIAFGAGADAAPRAYWSMRFREDDRAPFPTLKSGFVRVLEDAVRSAADGGTCGTFLSGGTDSSTVTGMLTRVTGQPARAFSIGFDAAGYDEMDYARIAARHFGSEHKEYYVTPDDVVQALPRIATFYDQPFGNASAIPTYYCAKFAGEHGVTRLLAGDGGDELFGGNERYGKQHVLGLYHRLPAGVRHGLVEPLTRGVPLFGLPGLRKVRSYVEQASPEMPARYESYNLLNYLGPDNVLTAEFASTIDRRHPQALMRDAHAPYADRSLVNQLLGIDLRFTLADSDLPKVTRMCALAGVDVVFPLLDERVVEFSATLAPELKLKGTQLRWFFKEALRDFLPPQIITKQKHGFGLPVGTWLGDHAPLRDLARDAIDSLRPHGIVKPAFVDELIQQRLQQHARFFGTMVWILMMLGLWLDAHRPR